MIEARSKMDVVQFHALLNDLHDNIVHHYIQTSLETRSLNVAEALLQQ